MATKRVHREEEHTEYDGETGEVKKHSRVLTLAVPAEPDYIKLYLQDVAYLNNVTGCSDTLREVLKLMTYEGQIIINKAIKKRIAEYLKVTLGHVENQITSLVKADVLLRVDRGLYEANPHIFGKGHWKDIYLRRKRIEVKVTYDENGGRQVKYNVPVPQQEEMFGEEPFEEQDKAMGA